MTDMSQFIPGRLYSTLDRYAGTEGVFEVLKHKQGKYITVIWEDHSYTGRKGKEYIYMYGEPFFELNVIDLVEPVLDKEQQRNLIDLVLTLGDKIWFYQASTKLNKIKSFQNEKDMIS